MNANAYGGDLSRVLESVEVATPEGTDTRVPGDLGFAYRRSNLGEREIVARAVFRLSPAAPEAVKATLAEMRRKRREALQANPPAVERAPRLTRVARAMVTAAGLSALSLVLAAGVASLWRLKGRPG